MFFHDMKMLERVFWLKRIKGSGNPMHEATSTSGSFVTDVVAPLKKLLLTLSPIQSGSGTPSPDNVRPISGHTEVVTEVCGVNVWDEEWEQGYYDAANGRPTPVTTEIRSKNFIPVLPNTQYYGTGFKATSSVIYYDANKNYLGWGRPKGLFTTPSEAKFIQIDMGGAYGTTYNHDISINYPSTDHDYHAYLGTTYTTSLGRTVYGGTLDVVSGELVVDRAMVTFDGTESGWQWYADFKQAFISDALTSSPAKYNAFEVTYICDKFNACSNDTRNYNVGNYATLVSSGRGVAFSSPATSLADFISLIGSGVTFVYELATPQTYQLTPQQINSLIGQNNIITEDGVEVSEVVYMTRLVGSPLLGSPQTEDEPTEETNEEPIEETEEPEGE